MSDSGRTAYRERCRLARDEPHFMPIDLDDSVVLVTGGSRGIGAQTVRALHAAGARIAFSYLHSGDAARALVAELGPERCAAIACDAADSGAQPALVAGVVRRFGRIDVLVNNVAIFNDNPFDAEDYDAWRAGWTRTFAVNVFGVVDLTWHALRAMRKNVPQAGGTRGRIVNITSRAAHRGETTFADYGASKAALGNFTRSLARGCARDGIVAFSVAPGFIQTEMAGGAIERDGAAIRAEIPGGRIGTPGEVASIVVFFASGAADYATGTTIDVNGASYVR